MHGVTDIDDFMSFTDIGYKTYGVDSEPDTSLALSTILVKNLLSIQCWYGNCLQAFNGDPIHFFP
jgi:hypothetical protein